VFRIYHLEGALKVTVGSQQVKKGGLKKRGVDRAKENRGIPGWQNW